MMPCDSETPGKPGMALKSKNSKRAMPCRGCKNCHPLDNTVAGLQQEIAVWADSVYPRRTVHDILHKLMCEELPEFCLNPTPGEVADVILLVLDLANKLGISAQQAVRDKLVINRARKWKLNSDSGLMHHIEDT